jgi:hypothetical protein
MRSDIDYINPFASGSPYDAAHIGLWHSDFAGLAGAVGEELHLPGVGARQAYELKWECYLADATDPIIRPCLTCSSRRVQ